MRNICQKRFSYSEKTTVFMDRKFKSKREVTSEVQLLHVFLE